MRLITTIKNCLCGRVVRDLDSYFEGRGFESQPSRLFCWCYLFLFVDYFIELFRYNLKIYDWPCPNLFRGTGFWSSFPLIDSRDSFSFWTWAPFQIGGAQPTLTDVTRNFRYTIYITIHFCVLHVYDLSALVSGSSLFKEDYLQFFSCF